MPVESGALEALLRSLLPGVHSVRVQETTPLGGGWSTITTRVCGSYEDKAGDHPFDLVMREAPADGVLAPYDLGREYRILSALRGSTVPVPRPIGCDAEGRWLGRPCLVTEFVPAEALSFFGQATPADDPRLPDYFRTIAAIHALDWTALGLDFLDEAENGIDGELRRCEARLAYHGGPDTVECEMLAWLRAGMPAKTTKAFLHGDPNPANYLFAGARIAAVLDWELALVGDPRLDLGFYAALQTAFGGVWRLDAASFLRGYAIARPGADLSDLDFFEIVGLYRLAGFFRAAERLRGMDATLLWGRLTGRFREVASARK